MTRSKLDMMFSFSHVRPRNPAGRTRRQRRDRVNGPGQPRYPFAIRILDAPVTAHVVLAGCHSWLGEEMNDEVAAGNDLVLPRSPSSPPWDKTELLIKRARLARWFERQGARALTPPCLAASASPRHPAALVQRATTAFARLCAAASHRRSPRRWDLRQSI